MSKKSQMYQRVQKPKKLGLFEHVIGFVALVGLPAFVTLIAPVSTVKLDYDGEKVSARVTTNIFLVVPCWTRTLDSVTEVSTHFIAGTVDITRGRNGSRSRVRSENESAVVLKGPSGTISVSTSPVNDDERAGRVKEFLENPNEAGLWFYTVANWKFSVLVGGFLSLFALLYLTGITLAIGKWFWGHTFGRLKFPDEPDPSVQDMA